MPPKPKRRKQVETLRHDEAKRTNIPTAEYSSAMEDDERSPIEVAYAGSVKSQGALGVASSERGRGAARDLSALSI